MTTLYGGWGWCSAMVNTPTMLLLLGAVVTTMVLAVRFAARRPSDPPAVPTGAGHPRAKAAVAAHIAQGAPDDEFYRRLM